MREKFAKLFPALAEWELEKWVALPMGLLVFVAGLSGLSRCIFDALGWFPVTG